MVSRGAEPASIRHCALHTGVSSHTKNRHARSGPPLWTSAVRGPGVLKWPLRAGHADAAAHLGAAHGGKVLPEVLLQREVVHLWRQVAHKHGVVGCARGTGTGCGCKPTQHGCAPQKCPLHNLYCLVVIPVMLQSIPAARKPRSPPCSGRARRAQHKAVRWCRRTMRAHRAARSTLGTEHTLQQPSALVAWPPSEVRLGSTGQK